MKIITGHHEEGETCQFTQLHVFARKHHDIDCESKAMVEIRIGDSQVIRLCRRHAGEVARMLINEIERD